MKVQVRAAPFEGAKFGAWNMVVGGYAAATLGLLFDLPTIGSSGIPVAVAIGIAALIGIGILLAATGMLQLRRALDRDRRGARRGLGMQGLGLIVFLGGVIALQISPSFPAVLIGLVFGTSACALAIAGGFQVRNHYSDIGATSKTGVGYLVLGTALIFLGVGVILGSKIGYYFVLSDVPSVVVNDVGAALSACGCVVAAYSSFMLRGRSSVSRWRPTDRA